mmetsp:Transcript_132360/g.240782  ORF Transcript_132360/g.240782 Transcript_132360/m.240782 type:complete len:1053 (-) Transcript_132360:66-3224(-)
MPPKKKGKTKKGDEAEAKETAAEPMEVDEGSKKESEVKDAKEEKKAEPEVKEKAEEAKEEVKADETKEEAKEEAKEETKEEAKAEEESKEEAKEETKEEATEAAKEEGTEEGKEEAKDEAAEEKAEEDAAEEEEEPPEPKELEEDSAADDRPKVESGKVGLNLADSTLNVMPVAGGSLVMSLTEGGMQYLLAGVRANTGVKSGRYMFEMKIIESLPQLESSDSSGRAPTPHNLVRVGFSLAKSSLFLAAETESVCFDTEGYFYAGKKRSRVSEKFGVEQTVAVLLNLQEGSPNVNTVSLFIDGTRVSKPQALPELFVGKALYPTVTYKNVTLNINFGPAAKVPLPFACRMLSDAAAADLELASEPSASAVSEVLFPVGLPDHGVFDWVDDFLEKHPTYTELSDRKILDWASKSGVWRPKGYSNRSSNDQPDMGFGISLLDDSSVSRVVSHVAPVMRRDYVVAELKGNLIAEERKKALLRFGGPGFKKVAAVLVGEPTEEYKAHVRSMILGDKVAKVEAEKKKKAQEEERKRLHEERRKRTAEARKAASGSAAAKTEETAEEEKAEEAKEEEKAEEKAEDKPMEVEETKPTLTEEEEKLWYRKSDTSDLSQKALAQSYAKFSLPTTEEGFDEVKFIWQPAAESAAFVSNWVREMKRTQKAEDLKPSAWFKKEVGKWKTSFNEWKKKATEFKDPVKRKMAQRKAAEEAKKKADAEKAEAEKAEGDTEKKDGEEKEEEAEEKAEPPEINIADLNPLEVKDVTDVGNGEPLFSNFVYEDWAMLSIRFELFLLLHAFRKDLDDADRPSFPEAHLAYYYEKYYGKEFRLKTYAQASFADFIELVQDAVIVNETSGLLEGILAEDTAHDQFVRLAEEHRRDRERRVDAGDETAKLKFNRPAPPPRDAPHRPPTSGQRSGKDGSKGKSSDRGGKDSGKGKDRRGKDSPSDRKGKDSGKGKKDSGKSRHDGYSSSYDSGKNKYSSSYDSGKSRPSYSDKGHYSSHSSYNTDSSYSSQKRSYSAPAGGPPKQARTSSYSGSKGGGYSSGGSKGGGYSSGYRR